MVLWLFALSEHLDMPARPEKKLACARSSEVDEKVLSEFAALAHTLRIRSQQIDDLLQRDVDRDIARRLLLAARQPDHFKYRDLEGCITEVTRVIGSAQVVRE